MHRWKEAVLRRNAESTTPSRVEFHKLDGATREAFASASGVSSEFDWDKESVYDPLAEDLNLSEDSFFGSPKSPIKAPTSPLKTSSPVLSQKHTSPATRPQSPDVVHPIQPTQQLLNQEARQIRLAEEQHIAQVTREAARAKAAAGASRLNKQKSTTTTKVPL